MKFPILFVKENNVSALPHEDDLLFVNLSLLRYGFYHGLIVDSDSTLYRMSGARHVGYGRFPRLYKFWSQRARIEPTFAGEPRTVTLDEVKDLVLQSIVTHGPFSQTWGEIGFDEAVTLLQGADSLPAVVDIVRRYSTVRRELR